MKMFYVYFYFHVPFLLKQLRCSNVQILSKLGGTFLQKTFPRPRRLHTPPQPCPEANDCLTSATRRHAAQSWTPHDGRMQHAPFVSGSSHPVLCLGHSSNTQGRQSAMRPHCRGHTLHFCFLKGQVPSCPFSLRSVSLRADLRPQSSSSHSYRFEV